VEIKDKKGSENIIIDHLSQLVNEKVIMRYNIKLFHHIIHKPMVKLKCPIEELRRFWRK